MTTRPKHLVVIGASSGGIETLRTLVAGFTPSFPAPICVVLHTAPQSPALLASILDRAGPLPATNAVNRERLQPGRIYVAPPDSHLVIEPGIVRVTKGPRENGFRPAIDPLFRSAAQVYGPGAVGVILTGGLDDGTAGLWTVKRLGGTAIVQDPADALFSSMPLSAITHVDVDYVLPLAEIAPKLVQLASQSIEEAPVHPESQAPPEEVEIEVKIAMEENPVDAGLERVGTPSRFSCPECHGVLLELKGGTLARFRCHTGHAYSIASLLAAVSGGIEDSLWTAIRALEEGRLLMIRMAGHVRTSHDPVLAEQLLVRAEEARRQSAILRSVVMEREPLPADEAG